MKNFNASELKLKYNVILDIARREPVMLKKNGQDSIVIMAVEDYEKISRQMINAFQNFCDQVGKTAIATGLTEEKLDELLKND